MRAIIQRVKHASVSIDAKLKSKIGRGYLILLGVEENDDSTDVSWLAKKTAALRVFSDENQQMNLSVRDIAGEILVVSQFTLHANVKKGSRPSFIKAAKPIKAIELYEEYIYQLENLIEKPVESGEFGAMMDVELLNDGPVTIFIDTKNKE